MSRPIYIIARDIRKDWKKPNVYAIPYLEAMEVLDDIDEAYLFDSCRDVVVRFLCNSAGWRGEKARAIKAELKSLAGI